MRTISTAQEKVITATGRAEFVKVEVSTDGGTTWRDLSTYPGYDAVDSVSWGQNVDEPIATAEVVLKREVEGFSLAPLMLTAPANVAFTFGGSVSALLQLNRHVRISVAIVSADAVAASGDYFQVFYGLITSIDPAATDSTIVLECRDKGAMLADRMIEREKVYAFAVDGGADKGCYIWEPLQTYAVGDYLIPTEAKRNGKVFKATSITTGISGSTEPVWPTTLTNTVVDSGVTWTCQVATTTTGRPVENVMQTILDDNGLSAIVLYTPSSPSWSVKQWLQQRESVLEALRALALQIGWDLRFKWRSGTSAFELTFYQPDRAEAVAVQRTFSTETYSAPQTVKTDIARIRNKITVIYSDTADRDAAGNPKRKRLTVTDATSVTAYGTRFMEVAEAEASQIDTSTEATSMANAILGDLKEPVVDHVVDIGTGFPFAEIGDRYTWSANSRHYSSAQTLALYAADHSMKDGVMRTSLACRGRPAGGNSVWHQMDTRNQPEDRHTLQPFEANAGLTVTSMPVVGGYQLQVSTSPERAAQGAEFQYHVYPTSGTTLSSTTMVTLSRDREITLANLVPGQVYYYKILPQIRNGTRIALGQPSTEGSFTAGEAGAGHLASTVDWGRQPLNGGFETTYTGPASLVTEASHWTPTTGAWDSEFYIATSVSGSEGANVLRIDQVSNASIYSDAFNVVEDKVYTLRVRVKGVSGAGDVDIGIETYDSAGASLGGAANVTISASVTDWTTYTATGFTASGSVTAKVYMISSGTDAEVYVDAVQVRPQPPMAIYYRSGNTTVNDTTSSIVNYANAVVDTHTAVTTGASWKFTCPDGEDGYYQVDAGATIAFPDGGGANYVYLLSLFVDSAEIQRFGRLGGTAVNGSTQLVGGSLVYLAAGEELNVRAYQDSSGNQTYENSPNVDRISIRKVDPV